MDVEHMRKGLRSVLKDIELKVLSELVRNSRRSDRELAKAVGVSQPTISRTIKKIEKDRLVEYAAVPNLAKLDYEILAVIMVKRNHQEQQELATQKAKDFSKDHPNLIFVSSGNGLGYNRMAISVHKNYADYARFIEKIKREWAGLLEIDAFVIDLKGEDILRQLSFRYLADYLNVQSSDK